MAAKANAIAAGLDAAGNGPDAAAGRRGGQLPSLRAHSHHATAGRPSPGGALSNLALGSSAQVDAGRPDSQGKRQGPRRDKSSFSWFASLTGRHQDGPLVATPAPVLPPGTLAPRMPSITGRMPSVSGRTHSITGRLASMTGRVNSMGGMQRSLPAEPLYLDTTTGRTMSALDMAGDLDNEVFNEIQIMQLLDHPHLTRLHEVIQVRWLLFCLWYAHGLWGSYITHPFLMIKPLAPHAPARGHPGALGLMRKCRGTVFYGMAVHIKVRVRVRSWYQGSETGEILPLCTHARVQKTRRAGCLLLTTFFYVEEGVSGPGIFRTPCPAGAHRRVWS